MKTNNKIHRINIVTLGCSKNIVDTEVLGAQLKDAGIEIVYDSNENNERTVIINTCGFVNDAKEESINTILQYVGEKIAGRIDQLYVMGCLVERFKKDLKNEIPEVDQYFGVNNINEILQSLQVDYKVNLLGERLLSTPVHYAYLKISEGCNRRCSFCAIPSIRGKHISEPIVKLVLEAKKLAAKGVKELNLIAQDLTYYGKDIDKTYHIDKLLNDLEEIEGIEWIRLHYAFPSDFPLELLDIMAKSEKICKYLDIPFQHISDKILKSMRRGISKAKTIQLIETIRNKVPGIALRTTLMTGFPGETAKEFAELNRFVEEQKFERLGIFTYSEEEGTYAAKAFEDNVSQKIKEGRAKQIIEKQSQISLDHNLKKVGTTLKTLIDRIEGEYFIGRTEFDSPDVDNEVLIPNSEKLNIGQFFQIKIIKASEYELYGTNEIA